MSSVLTLSALALSSLMYALVYSYKANPYIDTNGSQKNGTNHLDQLIPCCITDAGPSVICLQGNAMYIDSDGSQRSGTNYLRPSSSASADGRALDPNRSSASRLGSFGSNIESSLRGPPLNVSAQLHAAKLLHIQS